MTIKVLLQTTITPAADDWSIQRFSLLAALLRQERDESGQPFFDVTTRDRDPLGAPDTLLSNLARSDYDQLWLFAVDIGNGLSKEDCRGIDAFRARGGGVLVARDHMDLGSSVCALAVIGAAEHFHTRNVDPTAPAVRDDPFTSTNIAVAFEADGKAGRAIAQSTFHHFADYNWDTRMSAPSFVEEPPGDGMLRHPEARAAAHRYARNVAHWLAGLPTD